MALELAGANAVHEITAKELRAQVTRLTDTNTGLQAEIDKVRGAMPGARPVAVASGGTGPIAVGPAAGLPVAGAPPASATSTPSPVCPACALRVGDAVELRVAGVALQGDSGAVAVAATAQAWRVGDPPVLLVEGPLKLEVQMRDPGELPGWGAGVLATAGREGWALGPAVSPPPLRVWGLEGSMVIGLALGPDGNWNAAGIGLLRW